MILYDHPASGNCLKARVLLRQLELPYERVTVDLFTGETRTEEHLARNADGRVPVLELDSGERIAESGAILLPWANAVPAGAGLARTRVQRWMFFEQNRIEPELAYARFLWLSGRRADAGGLREPARPGPRRAGRPGAGAGGRRRAVRGGRRLHGRRHGAVCLRALRRDAGADPREHPSISAWLDRVEATPRFENDLEPFPEHASARPT